MWDKIRGHQSQIELFRTAVRAGRLSQSYLLAGETGIGKKQFAITLAAGLFCQAADDPIDACGNCPSCRQVIANTHPDLLRVGCPPDKKELPIELLAGSRERRGREGLCYDISLKPMSADRRIAIIDDVETLNVASANTLLKTLEEPPDRAVFLLVVDRPEAVLPTIRSRSQLVRFHPLADRDVAELLVETGVVEDAAAAQSIASLAGGSLDAAKQLADPAVRDLNEFVASAVAGPGLDQAMTLAGQVMKRIEETSKDTQIQRSNAMWTLRFLGSALQAAMRRAATNQGVGITAITTSGPDAVDVVANMLQRVIDTEAHLFQRMPMLLCFEAMFDDLRRIASGQLAASA